MVTSPESWWYFRRASNAFFFLSNSTGYLYSFRVAIIMVPYGVSSLSVFFFNSSSIICCRLCLSSFSSDSRLWIRSVSSDARNQSSFFSIVDVGDMSGWRIWVERNFGFLRESYRMGPVGSNVVGQSAKCPDSLAPIVCEREPIWYNMKESKRRFPTFHINPLSPIGDVICYTMFTFHWQTCCSRKIPDDLH